MNATVAIPGAPDANGYRANFMSFSSETPGQLPGSTGLWHRHLVESSQLKTVRSLQLAYASQGPPPGSDGLRGPPPFIHAERTPNYMILERNNIGKMNRQPLNVTIHRQGPDFVYHQDNGPARRQEVYQDTANGTKRYGVAPESMQRTAPIDNGRLNGLFVPLKGQRDMPGLHLLYGITVRAQPGGKPRFVRMETGMESNLADIFARALNAGSLHQGASADWKKRHSVRVQVTYKKGHLTALRLDPNVYPGMLARASTSVANLFRR